MAAYYTAEDVSRWEENAVNDIPFQMEALRKPLSDDLRWQRYGSLAGDYETLAMIAIARKQYSEVPGLFNKRMEMTFEQFKIDLARGETVSAGCFQDVLIAYVTTEKTLISTMVNYYSYQTGIRESVFLGKIVKWIALGDLPTAQAASQEKRPRMEKMFEAYPDCLQAIVNRDQPAFRAAISVASKNWARRAARIEKGLPYAVCFLQGVGLVRLAQQIMGSDLSVSDEHIPSELLN